MVAIKKNPPMTIGGVEIKAGERKRIEIPVAKLFDYTDITMPVEVIRGIKDGPTLFVSSAIHGDEIIGTEVIRRLLKRHKLLKSIKGTIITVPIVNVFGYNRNSRYLPDRRDLNRCFPGSRSGSLGAQIAHTFMTEIVSKATHGIDLHTGAIHRTNLPQIRATLNNKVTHELAESFGVPVVLNAELRDGSLRGAVSDLGVPMLLFEGGEALRYDEKVITTALNGIINVMRNIGIAGKKPEPKKVKEVFIANSSQWIRAPHSGSLRTLKQVGNRVEKGEILGTISDPFGDQEHQIINKKTGVIIGMSLLPLVNNGDALYHVATFEDVDTVEEQLESFEEDLMLFQS